MRVTIIAGLIVAVHVVVIGSVAMTQGCASMRRGEETTAVSKPVEQPPPPPMPPVPTPVVTPQPLPPMAPPTPPPPLKTEVGADNIYVVKSGDSLSKIAAAHGVKVAELKELNQIADPNKIRAGQKLLLPGHAKPSQSPPPAKTATAKASPQEGATYEVKPGDSLSKIAAAHGVKLADLQAANQIADPNKIRTGQKLVIPGVKAEKKEKEAAPKEAKEPKEIKEAKETKEAKASEKAAEKKTKPKGEESATSAPADKPAESGIADEALIDYTVQEGDTVEGISRLFIVSKEDILKVNDLAPGQELTPGQKIKIPPPKL